MFSEFFKPCFFNNEDIDIESSSPFNVVEINKEIDKWKPD